ncbi:MAG: hypothetical protein AB7Q97_15750 [Gammaproteobacteria bacterium]
MSRSDVEAMPPGLRVVRVRVEDEWLCARIDTTRPVTVERMLLRTAVPATDGECPQCAQESAAPPAAPKPVDDDATDAAVLASAQMKVMAAPIAIQGRRLVVVAVTMDLVQSPGEADMAIDTLQPHFGGAPVVLMAQAEDGTPRYHGVSELVELLTFVPVDQMPWKDYSIG